jgi:hypothetical protein
MIVEPSHGGVLIPPEMASAIAALLRVGIDEIERRDALRMRGEVRRLLDELESVAYSDVRGSHGSG